VKRSVRGLLAAFSIVCGVGSYAACKTHIELRGESVDETALQQSTVSAREIPDGLKLDASPRGALLREISFDLPDGRLYRRIALQSATQVDAVALRAEVAVLSAWPCRVQDGVMLPVVKRVGDAAEVVGMWGDRSAVSPPDMATAAMYFARALSTAEIRHERYPQSKHQNDLIASYLALRAFRIYAAKSEVPLVTPPRLRPIAAWYLQLLTRVDATGLGAIAQEGQTVANELVPMAQFYTSKWREIKQLADRVEALDGLQRFRASLEAEADTQAILTTIGLTMEEIVNSTSQVAGEIEADRLEAARAKLLVEAHVRSLGVLIARPGTSERARESFRKDLNFIKRKFRF
jgi:hypothetical protein